MTRQAWEQRLLNEYDTLNMLNKLLTIFVDLLDQIITENGDKIDDDLCDYLKVVLIMTRGVNELIIVDPETDAETDGITKQMDDVMDEINTFQAGLPTKRGVPEEDDDEVSPKSGDS